MTKQIPLNGKHGQGKFAIVDDADYEFLNQYRWFLSKNGYAFRFNGSFRKGGKPVLMHNQILVDCGLDTIDHIDRDKLNNTRDNLRPATYQQNNRNTGKKKSSSSKYKGVHWNKRRNRWMARLCINYKSITLGQFLTEAEAALAYNRAAIAHFGEFAYLNTIEDNPLDIPVAKPKTPKKSRFRGVSKNKYGKPWTVHVRINGRTVHVGRFDDEVEAAKVYDALAKIHCGEKAVLNFP